jgi:hypothetical protein
LETPCESRDFESSKTSFNNGFKLSVCSLARYKIACELIKFSTGRPIWNIFYGLFSCLP